MYGRFRLQQNRGSAKAEVTFKAVKEFKKIRNVYEKIPTNILSKENFSKNDIY